MSILRFKARRQGILFTPERLTALDALLAECRSSRRGLVRDRLRLRSSLGRLRILTKRMIRDRDGLRRRIGRLNACRPTLQPRDPAF
ncbi:MAG TPA: hypothetical protein VFT43_07715 [Candidatus Polarisedimenticolia bacterium]|nr:hypothetical protein [Candidatus Polarisedimenticolia bacterium]